VGTRNSDATSRHDQGYKRLFSHPATVEELIRGFLREDWVSQLDFSTLERVGSSFVSDAFQERHSDVIWRLRFKDGERGWFYLYLLLEFQSTSYHFMAVRLLGYVSLLLEEIIRKHKLRAGDRLPPVLPIVAYNGKRPWKGPLALRDLYLPVPPGLRRWLPDLTYILLDEGRLDLERPDLDGNRVAAAFRVETCKVSKDLPELTRRLNALLPPNREPELRQTFMIWLHSVLQRTFPGAIIPVMLDLEEVTMLEETAREWRRKIRREGLREGRQEGKVEGMRTLLLQMLAQRFGRVPIRIRRRVAEISSDQELRKLAREALVAESLQDLGLG
jgi:predicted transposase YdaD